jgi:hypothetical protein
MQPQMNADDADAARCVGLAADLGPRLNAAVADGRARDLESAVIRDNPRPSSQPLLSAPIGVHLWLTCFFSANGLQHSCVSLRERLIQVLFEIIHILDADRDPDHPVGDADRGTSIRRHRRMRHHRRV